LNVRLCRSRVSRRPLACSKRGERGLADIEAGHPLVHDFHVDHLPHRSAHQPPALADWLGVARRDFCRDTDPRARNNNPKGTRSLPRQTPPRAQPNQCPDVAERLLDSHPPTQRRSRKPSHRLRLGTSSTRRAAADAAAGAPDRQLPRPPCGLRAPARSLSPGPSWARARPTPSRGRPWPAGVAARSLGPSRSASPRPRPRAARS
jgi:hypothetical protein